MVNRIVWAVACVVSMWLADLPAAAQCGGIPSEGCCDGTTLKFCRSDDTLAVINCDFTLARPGVCSWNFGFDDGTAGHYQCDFSDNPNGVVYTDPAGAVPRACPAPAGACIPDCRNKDCGPDGCGGTCGTCPTGTCREFMCQPTGVFCGEGSPLMPPLTGCCDGTLYRDCDLVSGLRATQCDYNGNDQRCGVSNGTAGCFTPSQTTAALPDCAFGCQRTCAGKTCGDDGCGGSCGGCAAGQACRNGACESPVCSPACVRGQTCTFGGCKFQECIAARVTTPTLVTTGSVAVWGPDLQFYPSLGTPPAMNQGANSIVMGGAHAVALDNNGDVKEWGGNSVFGCGGPWTSLGADKGPMWALAGWRCGFIGAYGTGRVAVWGDGDYDQIQAAYADAITDAVAVAAGANFLVLRQDGTVSMFTAPGSPADVDELYFRYRGTPEGDALWDAQSQLFVSYVRALPGIAGARAIAAHERHYLVINGDGSIIEWGNNWLGAQAPPTELANNIRQVTAGVGYSLALLNTGALRMWIDDPLNVRERGILANVPTRRDFVAVAPGLNPGALAADGTVVMWDRNGPIAMPSGVAFVTAFAVGADQSGNALVAAVTRCEQDCTPSCNATTCQVDGCGGICPNCGGCNPSQTTCACVPQCDGKSCGPDGCGGTCGTCGAGQVCTSTGRCDCVPDCTGKTCGPNGCGGTCGSCSAPTTCTAAGTCACVPQCDGKSCGPDGCGGTCGTCGARTACSSAGQCECVPSCNGKTCGDDGCGGSCGYCGARQRCTTAGTCECAPSCEVRVCDQSGCSGYSRICGPDGCGGTCGQCPAGEMCNDDGTACGCIPSCTGKACGTDGCGGSCGFPDCPTGQHCVAGQCECKPFCRDWPDGITGCGSDGCGGTCGTCPGGTQCRILQGSSTGEGICECAPSCSGRECGPDGCGGSCGVDQFNTFYLGGCARAYGNAWSCNVGGQCQCVPDCTGKQCGDDGCGGQCGTCRAGTQCSDDAAPGTNPLRGAGRCQCQPQCNGKQCYSDGCGGTCGTCAAGTFCNGEPGQCVSDPCADIPTAQCCVGTRLVTCDTNGRHKVTVQSCGTGRWACGWTGAAGEYDCGGGGAVDPSGNAPIQCPASLCVPDCLGKQCGPDGCGGSCGDGCAAEGTCNAGFCVYPCQPECRGRECGTDGCGGTCGTCPVGEACAGGACCTPQCNGKVCGPDGCGGVCGDCADGSKCNGSGQCEVLPCDGFTREAGCCMPDNRAVWCDTSTNTMQTDQCGSGRNCGWDRIRNRYRCFDATFSSDPSGQQPYLCPADTCVRNCFGKNCGNDGCGGTCGTCGSGQECSGNGVCFVPPPPCDCTGKCAADGCTGSCPDTCPAGQACLKEHRSDYLCAPGQSCGYVDPYGTCVEPCEGAAPVDVGCCSNDFGSRGAVAFCPSNGTASARAVSVTQCAADQPCGWSGTQGKFACGGTDTPPNGVELYCPGACSCAGRECGDDGCGNSCGTCTGGLTCSDASVGGTGQCIQCSCVDSDVSPLGFTFQHTRQCGADTCGNAGVCGTCPGEQTCSAGTLSGGITTGEGRCQRAASCGSVTEAGQCNGNVAQFCTAYGIQEQDCALTGERCLNARCVSVYGSPNAAPRVCSPTDCGQKQSPWSCQCDVECLQRGDCCDNYDAMCGLAHAVGSCGDSVCRAAAGEDCLTCSTDCGACPVLAADSTSVMAPYARTMESAGLAGQQSTWEVMPLDDVRPGAPPWPRAGLQAYLPAPGINAGSPATLVLAEGAAASGQVFTVNDGVQGAAFSFNGSGTVRGEGMCVGRSCGPDGAGGTCGTCPSGSTCDAFAGTCFQAATCVPKACSVNNAQCGTDGCGNPCGGGGGTCPNGGYCSSSDRQCWTQSQVDTAAPCVQRECGPTRWSNLSCGSCGGGETCSMTDGACRNDASAAGVVRIVPADLLPQNGNATRHTEGGATLAFWARVPSDSLTHVNPLASVRAADTQPEVCNWGRPGDTSLRVTCPNGRSITAVQVYWGAVESAPGADGLCDTFRSIRPTGACESPVPAQEALNRCIGQTTCYVDTSLRADPCESQGAGSVLSMRAVCDLPRPASATLYVGNRDEQNRLFFSLPSGTRIASDAPVPADRWTHVAVVYQRRPRGLGDVSLWMDGKLQATAAKEVFPDAYEWDLGAGYFGNFPSVPNAINSAFRVTAFDGSILGLRSPWNVAGVGDADDIFLYDRPLSRTEIGALFRKPGARALRVWPAVDAARTVDESPWVGAAATTTPVEALALLDRTRSTSTNRVKLGADELGVRLPAGTAFAATDRGTDLVNLSAFTLAAWVRASALTSGTNVLELVEGATPQLVLSLAGTCSSSAVTAWLRGAALTPSSSCVHGMAAGEWAFVAYVQDATSQAVYVDGVRTASGTAPQPIFSDNAATQRTLRGGNGVDLSWASLFGRAYLLDELEALRTQGPAVWIEGSLPVDLAAFHNNPSGTAADRATLWTGASGPATAGSGATITVPARGRFRPLGSTEERAFSWSGQVGFPSSAGNAAVSFPLFQLDQPGSRLAEAALACTAADTSGRVACHVRVAGVGTDGRFHRWASDNRVVQASALAGGGTARVAIAFNRAPSAALYFVAANGSAVPLAVQDKALLTLEENGAPITAPSSNATATRFVLPSATPGSGATWSDLRLYNRVLTSLDLVALVSRGCGAQECGTLGRVCTSPTRLPGAGNVSVDLSACGSCDSVHVDRGGVCVPKQVFLGSCVEDLDCASALCGPNETCLATTADTLCQRTCSLQHRACELVDGTTGYACSPECLDEDSVVHVRSRVQNIDRCDWYPTVEPGEVCDSDYDCVSRACLPAATRQAYDVAWSVPATQRSCASGHEQDCCLGERFAGAIGDFSNTVLGGDPALCAVVNANSTRGIRECAGFDRLGCEALNRVAAPTTADVPGYGDMSLYGCGGCKEGYQQQWTMLSPQACSTLWTNYYALGDYKNANYQGKYEMEAEPSITTLRRLLLRDSNPTSAATPRIYSQLAQAGAGPILLNWERLSEDDKNRYRNYGRLWLADCNKTTVQRQNVRFYTPPYPSAFSRAELNHVACVAQRQADGATCPQPGISLDRAHAGQNCMSGFCAADTATCEDGGFAYEENNGAARNDANKGGDSSSNFGGLGLTQRSYNYTRVTASPDTTLEDRRTYGMGLGSSFTVNVFGLLQYDALDINVALASEVEAETGTYDQVVEVFGLDVPIPLPDRPESVEGVTHQLAGCGAAEWDNGEWASPDCEVTLDEDGQPTIDNVEPLEIAIPLPIGECEDWDLTSAQVATSGGTQKGKLCFKKTTIVGFVPVTVKAEVTFEVFLSFGAVIDDETLALAFEVAPGIRMGLDVRGGVGIQEFITVYAGVYGTVEIVSLSFPITWTLGSEKLSDQDNHIINGLYAVKYTRELSIELAFLKMAVGIFVELGIGPFSHEWTWDLLGFEGIRLRWGLSSSTLSSTKVDFEWQP